MERELVDEERERSGGEGGRGGTLLYPRVGSVLCRLEASSPLSVLQELSSNIWGKNKLFDQLNVV